MREAPSPDSLEAKRPAAAPSAVPGRRAEAAGWALFAGGASIVAITRTVDAAPAGLVLLAAVQPWVELGLVAGCAALALLPFAGSRAWRPFVALAVLWLGIWGRAWSTMPVGAPLSTDVRVLTWNVQRLGFGDATRERCVVDAVRAADPELLALQEVSARDLGRLSDALALDCIQTDYEGEGSRSDGGLAACARAPWKLRTRGVRPYREGRSWVFPWAEAERDGEIVNLVSVHLHPYGRSFLSGAERVADAQADEAEGLARRVRTLRDPTIVAGDFNSVRDSAVHARLRGGLTDAYEAGAWGPGRTVSIDAKAAEAGLMGPLLRILALVPLRVDYVYTTDHFEVPDAEIPDVACSDHRPVAVSLRWR